MSVARAACDRLLQRLAGTQPDHRPESLRIGSLLVQPGDPQLTRLIPAATRAAAVLIGLQDIDSNPGILLTVRAGHLRQHAGQISFPGGVVEEGDTGPAAAALREAREEIGLREDQVEVVGFLPDQLVLTGFRITPVVARIVAGFDPRPDRAEVQETFVLPFAALLDQANHHPSVRSIAGIEFPMRDLQFGPHRIWGATAGMLFVLYELAQA